MNNQLFGPLEIEGFTFERVLGSGGFADVFLYSQEMPRRRVAVKILRAVVTDETARRQFESEANLMAQLSSHPSIVTIHYAAVADNGRPYLVMEYCSKTNLADRYKQRLLSVPEMLQTTVRLCGAVETAHLAGILHRDIKPANVLTTDYGWPALTDFGISVIAGEATVGVGGVSIPWAPPEALGGPGKVDQRSDVYSLAATAYTVLAGHSPFDLDGTQLDMGQFMQRILREPVPPIGREDVPNELERLLALALSKDPDSRPQTASSLARSLQRIEQDMRLPITHMDIPGGLLEELEGRSDESVDDEAGSTRIASASDRPRVVESVVDEADDRTTVSARGSAQAAPSNVGVSNKPAEPDVPEERTTVRNREDEIDERTRVAGGREPDDHTRLRDQPSDRTQVSAARARDVAVPTTATDVPVRSSRIAYVPAEDAAARVERYTTRKAVPINPIVRTAPTMPQFSSTVPQTETAARRTVRAGTKRGVLVIVVVVVVTLAIATAAVVGAILIIGGGA